MNKIVQLTEDEYNRLAEKAHATDEIINKAVEKEVKKLCNLRLELRMDIGRDWSDTFHITPYASLAGNWVFGDKTVMGLDAAHAIGKKIKKWMQKMVEDRYGFGISQVNRYTRANENHWKWIALWTVLSASGWVAAMITWMAN